MKHIVKQLPLLVAATMLFTAIPVQSVASEAARAVVRFEQPEKFTDLDDGLVGSEKGREYYMKLLRTVVEEEAASLLPKGQTLTITFTDIDLAGSYLPSAAANNNVRVIKEIFAPRMKFTYSVTDAQGKVLKQGQENISDLSFMNRIEPNRSDELFFDKALLKDWLRKTLKS